MQQISFDVIGTHLDIHIDIIDSIDFISQKIQSRLYNFEQKFSRFISGNWLYNLNQERSGILDQDGLQMLSQMLEIAKNTDGYFDPTIGKRLTDLGYGKKELQTSSSSKSGYGDYRDIKIDKNQIILHGNIELEFGGIGKGYLIDVIHTIIENSAFSSTRYLINFGGDMYGHGEWNIGLESPFASDEVIGTILLDDLFLACSAGTKRKWGDHHHLIDPHTGESAYEVVASYIEGNSGMMVDGYATALCVMPWNIACAIFEKTVGISGVIVSREGNIYQKEGSRAEIFQ